VVGDNVKLATVTLVALAPGESTFGIGVTSGDSTEGFPEYDPIWAELLFGTRQTVTVQGTGSSSGNGNGTKKDDESTTDAPEPGTLAMIVLGIAMVRRSGRVCWL
jgi:hypothetical protein